MKRGPPATHPPRPARGSLGQPTSGLCLDESSGLRRPGWAGARPSFGRKALALVRRTGHGPYQRQLRFSGMRSPFFSRSASRRSGSAAQITGDPPHGPRIDSGNDANSAASRYAAGVRFLQTGTRPPGGGPSNASDRAHDLSKLRRSQRGPGHRELVFGSSLSVWGHAPGRTDRAASMGGSLGVSGRARAQLPGAGRR
jgi:hypothetical protein